MAPADLGHLDGIARQHLADNHRQTMTVGLPAVKQRNTRYPALFAFTGLGLERGVNRLRTLGLFQLVAPKLFSCR